MAKPSTPELAVLRVAPFVKGVWTRERVIVRRADGPEVLCLTQAEVTVVEELTGKGCEATQFLGRYLGGHGAVDFKTAVTLIVRLYQAHFLVDVSADVVVRLREVSSSLGDGNGRGGGGALARGLRLLGNVVDLPLAEFSRLSVPPVAARLGGALVSAWGLLAVVVLLATLGTLASLAGELPDSSLWTADLAAPEALLLKTSFAFSLATSFTALVQLLALGGLGVEYARASIKLTGLCVVRLAVDDDDAFLLPRRALARYRLLTLVTPWAAGLATYQLSDVPAFGSLASLLAAAFGLLGVALLCPLYRSPLVKLAEGYLATLNLLERANAYLATGLLSALFRRTGGIHRRGQGSEHGEHATQQWLAFFACVSLLWLYGMSLLFSSALLSAVPDLYAQATRWHHPFRAFAAAVALLVMGLAVGLPLARLALIPLQNLVAVAAVPLRRARKGIGSYYDKSLPPSAAVAGFLREIPILADLQDVQLAQLMGELKFRAYGKGQNVITKGDAGEEFFILADGQAQVLVGGAPDGTGETVVDLLSPGDSFGEIALIEHVKRTATIRAMTAVKTLVLGRDAFDRLFPDPSEARSHLTSVIRQVKLVLESQALSHLAPRQIGELLRTVRSVQFKAGEFLMHEGDAGEVAYLVESGEVQVVRERAATEVAVLGRGELLGQVALLKDVTRTASVRARTDVTCLEIDKATFLRMVMSNVLVALLVTDLSDRQVADLRAAG